MDLLVQPQADKREGQEGLEEDLFRPRMVNPRRTRLEGDVIVLSHKWMWRASVGIFLLVGFILLSICFVEFSRTARVPGWLTTDKGMVLVQAFKAGVIQDLMVREGQQVKAGQVLLLIRVESVQPKIGATPEAALLGLIEQQDQWMKQQIELADQRAKSERGRARDNIGFLRAQIAALDSQLVAQKTIAKSAEKDAATGEALASQDVISLREAQNRESAFAGSEKELSSLQERRELLQNQLSAAQVDFQRAGVERDEKVAELEASRAAIKQHGTETQGQQMYALTAPIAGRVTNLMARPGYPADGRRPLLALIPEHSTLQAELFIPSKSVGFIRSGQAVRLQYDAFPFERFGSQSGIVKWISGSALLPTDVSAPVELKEPVYIASVRLDQQTISAFGRENLLQPGMVLHADVILERRSVFQWLFEPLFAARGGA